MFNQFKDKIEDYPKVHKIKSFELSEEEIVALEKMRMEPEETTVTEYAQLDLFSAL